MKKSIVSIGLSALLFATASLRADDNKTIKAGVGIGPFRLKADVSEAEKLLGDSPDLMLHGRGARVSFVKSPDGKEEEIVVLIRRAENGQDYYVNEVAVTSPDYHTPEGNSTKSDLAAIWREFPDLEKYEVGEAFDGTTVVSYRSKDSGVSVLVERPPGTPISDKPEPGVPSGKCRAFIVQIVGTPTYYIELGRRPKKTDAD